MRGEQGDAHADGHGVFVARACKRFENPLASRAGVVLVFDEDEELVSADAGGDVRFADAALHAQSHLLQDFVAEQVTVAVVSRLELIQVEQHERESLFVVLMPFELRQDGLPGGFPMEHARERVGARLAHKAVELQLLFMYVHAFADEAGQGLFVVSQPKRAREDLMPTLLVVDVEQVARAHVGVVGGRGKDEVAQAEQIFPHDDLVKAHVPERVRDDAGQPQHFRTPFGQHQ